MTQVKTFFKETPEQDEKYKAFIRKQDCVGCGVKGKSVAHHQPKRYDSTMGGKCSDYRTLPLCRPHYFRDELVSCHSEYHNTSWPFWEKRGLDVELLINTFNSKYKEKINT